MHIYLTREEIEHPYADIRTMLEDKRRKAEQMSKTVFHHITQSPEVLAPKFIYYTVNRDQFGTYYWYCSALIPGEKWSEEAEAIAATVAKLKEVVK